MPALHQPSKARTGTPATVVGRRALSPRVLCLTLQGPGGDLGFHPGCKIKLGVPGVFLKSYTPAAHDPDSGRFEVVFHLHGLGEASRWAASATAGDEVVFLGPAPSMKRRADVQWARFFGDETTLGLARALLDALPDEVEVAGAIEALAEDVGSVGAYGLPLDAVARAEGPGRALVAHVEAMPLPDGPGVVWVSGHAGTVLEVRNLLRARGVDPASILVKPYWSDKGHAHRKALEKGALRA